MIPVMSSFCGNGDVTKLYVIEPIENSVFGNLTASTITVTDITVEGNLYNCESGSTAFFNTVSACTDNTINVGSDLTPVNDASVDVGTPFRRYREVNTVNGMSSIWASTVRVVTPEVTLGYDSNGELRILTANSSILQNDVINGGSY